MDFLICSNYLCLFSKEMANVTHYLGLVVIIIVRVYRLPSFLSLFLYQRVLSGQRDQLIRWVGLLAATLVG